MDLSAISAASIVNNYLSLIGGVPTEVVQAPVGAPSADPAPISPGVVVETPSDPVAMAPVPVPASPLPAPEPIAPVAAEPGRAWGMLRNLAAGHYNAVASARLRENFAEEIAANGIAVLAPSSHAGRAYGKHGGATDPAVASPGVNAEG
jgi:hypothetical protein